MCKKFNPMIGNHPNFSFFLISFRVTHKSPPFQKWNRILIVQEGHSASAVQCCDLVNIRR